MERTWLLCFSKNTQDTQNQSLKILNEQKLWIQSKDPKHHYERYFKDFHFEQEKDTNSVDANLNEKTNNENEQNAFSHS